MFFFLEKLHCALNDAFIALEISNIPDGELVKILHWISQLRPALMSHLLPHYVLLQQSNGACVII